MPPDSFGSTIVADLVRPLFRRGSDLNGWFNNLRRPRKAHPTILNLHPRNIGNAGLGNRGLLGIGDRRG